MIKLYQTEGRIFLRIQTHDNLATVRRNELAALSQLHVTVMTRNVIFQNASQMWPRLPAFVPSHINTEKDVHLHAFLHIFMFLSDVGLFPFLIESYKYLSYERSMHYLDFLYFHFRGIWSDPEFN